MTVEEIFTTLAKHMLTGIAMHEDFVHLYDFLSLKGFKKDQYCHYLEEIKNYQDLRAYYMQNYNKLLEVKDYEKLSVIPASWYKYTQFDASATVKQTTIKDIMTQWVKWEKSTMSLISSLHKELTELNEIGAADYFQNLFNEVSKEFVEATQKQIDLETVDYSLLYILKEQKHIEKYSKVKKIFRDN